MNRVILKGRLTKDPEIRYAGGESVTTIARYTLAVDRRFKKDGEADTADYIQCTCFGKTAEFAEKYLKKGMAVLIEGRLQTGKYEKDGETHYTWTVVVDQHEFCEKKSDDKAPATLGSADGFMNIPDGIEEELPFN